MKAAFRAFYRLIVIFVTVSALIAAIPPSLIAQDFSATVIDNFVDGTVMEVVGDFDKVGTDDDLPRRTVAREFIRTHSDTYDFLIVFTDFEYQMPSNTVDDEKRSALGFYTGVRNDVQGIGKPVFDNSAFYGSNGKLQGFIDMGCIHNTITDPLVPGFTDVLDTLSHELLHRWSGQVRFLDTDGAASDALLGPPSSDGGERDHWSFLLDTDGSVGFTWSWTLRARLTRPVRQTTRP